MAVNELLFWSTTWGLPIALCKTNVLHPGKNNPLQIYHIGTHPIEAFTQIRDLDVIVDDNLSFEPHINRIVFQSSFFIFVQFFSFVCIEQI